jgi:hypothetical protein
MTFRSGAELLAILADLRAPLVAPGVPVPATTVTIGAVALARPVTSSR